MAVGGLLPTGAEVPVISDVVVIENHQRRQVRQCPRHLRQTGLEGIDAAQFTRPALSQLAVQRWPLKLDQAPRHG